MEKNIHYRFSNGKFIETFPPCDMPSYFAFPEYVCKDKHKEGALTHKKEQDDIGCKDCFRLER